jgi:anti-sigma factor (TIGR02949 family)
MNQPASTGGARRIDNAGNMGNMGAMLNCTAAEQRLQRFLDHELTEEEAAEVRMHLEQCENCRSRFRFEASLRRLVRQGGRQEAAPEGLRVRVQDLIQRLRRQP